MGSDIGIGIEGVSQGYQSRRMMRSYEMELSFSSLAVIMNKELNKTCSEYTSYNLCYNHSSTALSLESATFKFDYLRVKNTLVPKLYDFVISSLRGGSSGTGVFDVLCTKILLLPISADNNSMCEGLDIGQPFNLTLDQLALLDIINVELNFEGDRYNFNGGKLFMIKREKKAIEYSKDDLLYSIYTVEFMVESGNENILGMVFLDGKVIGYDSNTGVLNLGDIKLPNDQQENQFGFYVAVKVTLDIFIFIFLITLIFSTIIGLDKFINDDES